MKPNQVTSLDAATTSSFEFGAGQRAASEFGRSEAMKRLLIIMAVVVAGCASHPRAVLSKGTDTEIRAAAMRVARADLASGHPRICLAGGRAVYAVGVPASSENLVEGFPRWDISRGCTDPIVQKSVIFAEAYNHEIVAAASSAKHE